MERVMSELTQYFSVQEKYEVHLLLYGITREIFYSISADVIIHEPAFEFNNNRRTWFTLKTLWFLRKEIKIIKPDTILSFGELWNNFVLLATLGLKYPVYVSDRCQPDKHLGKFHELLRTWLYPKAAGIICQTETAKHIYQKKYRHKNFQVIGNPIRAIDSNPKIQRENIILSVGRLIKTKHHDELIRIFASINQDEWKLVIVGADAIKQQNKVNLEALIEELGMQSKVILAGNKSNVDDFYNRAKIFAFTSSSEGFPNVIGEAMSAGLPVVAYDCVAGPRDLISHEETGFLVALHNTHNFKISLMRLMNDESLRIRMGRKGKEKIESYSVERIGKKIENTIFSEGFAD
jgi:glycosyltransferase involved in cell wall biosynthesis